MVIYTCPECGGDLVDYVITTYPPISAKKCLNCDWRWEDKMDVIKRVPFDPRGREDGNKIR